ncbi:MAG: zinc-binding dehydrogenase, partial [Gammaproteobacteria bacterium]|nr:zinc-binding dehydrogenase [Gammaproteobacteria bacterium]
GFLGQNIFLPLITPVTKPLLGNRKTIFPFPDDIRGSLLLIKDLIEKGEFKAVIDREYPMEKIVEAYKYVGEKHKTGSVVITVGHEN